MLQAGTAPGSSDIVNFNTGSTNTTFTATNVPAGTYYVRVRASNVDGPGAASNEVTIVVGSVPCTPSAPPSLSGSASGSTVTLTWSSVSGAMGFIVEAGSAPGASTVASFDTGSAATSYTANDVPAGTYYVRARARTSCGTSGSSNEVTVTVSGLSLSGTWAGTVSRLVNGLPAPSETFFTTFQHVGDNLTGTGPQARFALAQTASSSTTRTFSGTFVINDPGELCNPSTQTGSMVADIVNNTMSGTFSGRNLDCLQESSTFSLRKQ